MPDSRLYKIDKTGKSYKKETVVMLELIIAVLPGILAVVIYRIQHGQNVGEGGVNE